MALYNQFCYKRDCLFPEKAVQHDFSSFWGSPEVRECFLYATCDAHTRDQHRAGTQQRETALVFRLPKRGQEEPQYPSSLLTLKHRAEMVGII